MLGPAEAPRTGLSERLDRGAVADAAIGAGGAGGADMETSDITAASKAASISAEAATATASGDVSVSSIGGLCGGGVLLRLLNSTPPAAAPTGLAPEAVGEPNSFSLTVFGVFVRTSRLDPASECTERE